MEREWFVIQAIEEMSLGKYEFLNYANIVSNSSPNNSLLTGIKFNIVLQGFINKLLFDIIDTDMAGLFRGNLLL